MLTGLTNPATSGKWNEKSVLKEPNAVIRKLPSVIWQPDSILSIQSIKRETYCLFSLAQFKENN